jgi:hypothetical protein
MRRFATLVTILVALTTSAFAQDQVATTTDMVKSADAKTQVGRLLGFSKYSVDVIGMSLTFNDGVRVRDRYEVRRGDKTVATAMVVCAGPTNTLLTLEGDTKNVKLLPTDTLVKVGHVAPPYIKVMPKGDTVHVVERDFLSSRTYIGQTTVFSRSDSFSIPGFSMPRFDVGYFTVPQFSGSTSSSIRNEFYLPQPNFGESIATPKFTLPRWNDTGLPSVSIPGF